MSEKRGILVMLAVVLVLAAGGVMAPTFTSHPASKAEAFTAPAVDPVPADACSAGSDGSDLVSIGDQRENVKPGCCSTQCNIDKDCDRICGKGVCACIQETPCCRHCVY